MDNVANFAISNLSAGIDSSATTISLVSGGGSKFPSPPFNAVLWNANYGNPADDPNVEIVRVTAISGDSLTVTRGQEGTAASAHNTSGVTYRLMLPVTAKTFNDISAHINSRLNPHSVTAAQIGIAINLKDYGAVGDGNTDDTTAIENAINAAISNHQPIFVPYGTYLINHKIIVSDDLDFISFTKFGSYLPKFPVISITSGFTDDAMFETQYAEKHSLTFNGIRLSASTSVNAVNVNNTVIFSGAVKFIECSFDHINIIYNGMSNDGGIEFSHCATDGNINQIANIYQTHSFIFKNNFMAANEGIIFSTNGASHESLITNNIISVLSGAALKMQNNYNDIVTNNIIRASGSNGSGALISVGNTSAGTSGNNLIISNNAFDGASVYSNAIVINKGLNNTIINNITTHFTDTPIVDTPKSSFVIRPNDKITDENLADLNLNKLFSGNLTIRMIDFQTYDNWETDVAGSGSVVQNLGVASVHTGTTANSYARMNTNTNNGIRLYGNNNINAYRIYTTGLSEDVVSFVGIANVKLDTQTDHTLTTLHAGLFYDNGQFYASSSDGTTQTLTPVSISGTDWLVLKNDGNNIKFYWGNTLIATHPTTNVYGYAQIWINNKSNTLNHFLQIYNIYLRGT